MSTDAVREDDDDDARRERTRPRRGCIACACIASSRLRALERDDDDETTRAGSRTKKGRARRSREPRRLTQIRLVFRAKGSVGTPRVDAVWWIDTD